MQKIQSLLLKRKLIQKAERLLYFLMVMLKSLKQKMNKHFEQMEILRDKPIVDVHPDIKNQKNTHGASLELVSKKNSIQEKPELCSKA